MFCENSFSAKTINNRTSEHVDNYCVLDIETTSLFVNTARIIEIAAIKVVNNKVVDEFSSLINPQCKIPEEATSINHITNDIVQNAPVLGDVIEDFLAFISDNIIVGYNVGAFDMNIINNRFRYWKGVELRNNCIDILDSVRANLKNKLNNCKLDTVSKYFGIDTFGNHRALKDCYLTKNCYDELYNMFGNSAFSTKEIGKPQSLRFATKYTNESLLFNEFQEIVSLILKDDNITEDEFLYLLDWKYEHSYLSEAFPYSKIFKALDCIISDGLIEESEINSLKSLLSYILDPACTSQEESSSITDKHVCFTGSFDVGRGELEKVVTQLGGIIDSTVKRSTNYVVIGNQGSDMWISGNYGGKVKKAMEWIEKGVDIKIIKENDFIKLIKYTQV